MPGIREFMRDRNLLIVDMEKPKVKETVCSLYGEDLVSVAKRKL